MVTQRYIETEAGEIDTAHDWELYSTLHKVTSIQNEAQSRSQITDTVLHQADWYYWKWVIDVLESRTRKWCCSKNWPILHVGGLSAHEVRKDNYSNLALLLRPAWLHLGKELLNYYEDEKFCNPLLPSIVELLTADVSCENCFDWSSLMKYSMQITPTLRAKTIVNITEEKIDSALPLTRERSLRVSSEVTAGRTKTPLTPHTLSPHHHTPAASRRKMSYISGGLLLFYLCVSNQWVWETYLWWLCMWTVYTI